MTCLRLGMIMLFIVASIAIRLDAQCDTPPRVLVSRDGAASDAFGTAISMTDDLLIVGAPGDDEHPCGSAYVFRLNDHRWVQEQKLIPNDDECGYFGSWGSVAISDNVAVVFSLLSYGGTYDYAGAYVYRFDGAQWAVEQKVYPSNVDDYDHYFGMSVDLQADRLVLGEWWDNTSGGFAGAVEVFAFDGVLWNQQQLLVASDGTSEHYLGYPIALDDNVIIAGAFGDDSLGSFSGAAYIYRFDGRSWIEEQKLLASDGGTNDFFGYGVDVSGDVAIVAAPVDDNEPEGGMGSAYIFRFDGAVWVEERKLIAPFGGSFPSIVAISENLALVGAHLYQFKGDEWNEVEYLSPDELSELSGFSNPLAFNQDSSAIGDTTFPYDGTNIGGVHLFDISCLRETCEGDANGDNIVDPLDSGYVLSRFGCAVGTGDADCDAADQNGDGVVDPLDVGYVLSRFGECD